MTALSHNAHSHTLPDGPINFAFCPAYDIAGSPQQIRIVFENMRGYVPTALVGLTLDDAELLCDRLNARLGLTRKDWTAIVARSMGAGGEPGHGLH